MVAFLLGLESKSSVSANTRAIGIAVDVTVSLMSVAIGYLCK